MKHQYCLSIIFFVTQKDGGIAKVGKRASAMARVCLLYNYVEPAINRDAEKYWAPMPAVKTSMKVITFRKATI